MDTGPQEQGVPGAAPAIGPAVARSPAAEAAAAILAGVPDSGVPSQRIRCDGGPARSR